MVEPIRTAGRRYWTLAQFLETDFTPQYGERPVELIDGLIVVDQAAPSRAHARLTAEIGRAFIDAIERGGAPCFTETGSDIQMEGRFLGLRHDFVLIPDLQVRCGRDTEDGEPLVVVEVLSPSNTAMEMLAKLRAYRTVRSLTDILIVFQDEMAIEHHHREPDGSWRGPEDLVGPEAALRIPRLGLEVPLAMLYRTVNLRPDAPAEPAAS